MTTPMPDAGALAPWDALAQQAGFRALLRAFSYPGTIVPLPGALLQVAATLIDGAVCWADPDELVDARLAALLESPAVAPGQAAFIVADASRTPRFEPLPGTLESPEHGATIILRVQRLGSGEPFALHGPGIEGARSLAVEGMASGWWQRRAGWNAGFPCGVDLILVDADSVVALPRTTVAVQAKATGAN